MELTVKKIVDDFDRETEAETRTFKVGDKEYLIDLADENANQLIEALQKVEAANLELRPFIQAARVKKSSRSNGTAKRKTAPARKKAESKGRTPRRRSTGSAPSETVMRNWAVENGMEVNMHGRLAKSVREAFIEAHKK